MEEVGMIGEPQWWALVGWTYFVLAVGMFVGWRMTRSWYK
jgi:hypothetical protein